ncbi:MAG: hypothetical protein ACOX6P_05750 [Candidatus Merdivicinus sp.]|jgi:hypothetical protein
MKASIWLYFGGGFLGSWLYNMVIIFVCRKNFSLSFFGTFVILMTGILSFIFFRRFANRRLNWIFFRRYRYIGFGAIIILLFEMFRKEVEFFTIAGSLLLAFPIAFFLVASIEGAFKPQCLRWRFRRIPFFRKKPSRVGLRRIAVSCMGGLCGIIPNLFLFF